jgi:hypothetical protein
MISSSFPTIPRHIQASDVISQSYQIIGINSGKRYGTISNKLYRIVLASDVKFTVYDKIDNKIKLDSLYERIVTLWNHNLFQDKFVDNFVGNYEQARRLLGSDVESSIYSPRFSPRTAESTLGYLEGLYQAAQTAIYTWLQNKITTDTVICNLPKAIDNLLGDLIR